MEKLHSDPAFIITRAGRPISFRWRRREAAAATAAAQNFNNKGNPNKRLGHVVAFPSVRNHNKTRKKLFILNPVRRFRKYTSFRRNLIKIG